MFVLGGSLCEPGTRHAAVPDTDPARWPPELDRALIVGGCTDWLVETLAKRGCEVTILEAPEHAEQAHRWDEAASVQSIGGIDDLNDFAASWFDAVFLLGGTIHTGGPFVGPDERWSAVRATWLDQLRTLVSRRGRIIADTFVAPDTAVRVVAAAFDTREKFALVEGVVMAGHEAPYLLLRNSAYDHDGVQFIDMVKHAEWAAAEPALEQVDIA